MTAPSRKPSARRCAAAVVVPRSLVDALGPFDLDPCPPPGPQPWPTATRCITDPSTNGLRAAWDGIVWLNPPPATRPQWLARLADHCDGGIAVAPARPDATWFAEHVWAKATAVAFVYGRLRVSAPSGVAGGRPPAAVATALIAYGDACAARLRQAAEHGVVEGAVISGWDAPRRQLSLFDTVNVAPQTGSASTLLHKADNVDQNPRTTTIGRQT